MRCMVSDYFDRQISKGSWSACKIPSFLIETFESRVDDSLQLDNSNGENVPPYACSFSTIPTESSIAAVADEDGQIRLLDTSKSNRTSIVTTWNCHSNAIFDTRWLPGERIILTASGDQTVGLHDLITRERIDSFIGHSSSVRTVDMQVNDSNVFTSASRDGTIRLWDRRNRKSMKRRGVTGQCCVACLTACHEPTDSKPSAGRSPRQATPRRRQNKRCSLTETTDSGGADKSVTSVAFVNGNTIASCGSTDGKIKLWDIRKFSCRGVLKPCFVFPYRGESRKTNIGYSHLLVDHANSQLFAVCRDHAIYQFGLQLMSQQPEAIYRGHYSSSFYIRASLSPDRRFLVCGSGDCRAYIYEVDRPAQPTVMLRGFEGEVTEVQWSPYDPSVIVALSDDCWIRIWRMNRRSQSLNMSHDDLWGLAEPRQQATKSPDSTLIDRLSLTKKLLISPLSDTTNQPNSPAVRQLNIETFLTPKADVKARDPTKELKEQYGEEAFSLMHAESMSTIRPCSPKKLVISPRKHKSVVDEATNSRKRGASSLQENTPPRSLRSPPSRKRLRFELSSEKDAILFDVQNKQESQISSNSSTGILSENNVNTRTPERCRKNPKPRRRISAKKRNIKSHHSPLITNFFSRSPR